MASRDVNSCDAKIRGPRGYGWCEHCDSRISAGKEWKEARRWRDADGTLLVHSRCYNRASRHGVPTAVCRAKRARSPHAEGGQQPSPMEPRVADATRCDPQPAPPRERKLVLVIREEKTPELDLPALFRQYGYARVPATDESRLLAHRVMQRSRRSQRGSLISGNTRQLEMTANDTEILEGWSLIIRKTAARLGIDATAMHIVDPKLLVTGPVSGFDQAVHFDCERGEDAANKFSALLFCSSGHMGTALPRFAASHDLSFSHEPQRMQQVARLLEPGHYESLPAMPGDVVFFAESTPHFGVRNSCPQGDRVVLFSILSPSAESMQDAHQVFPWLFVGCAFGWDSKQFAQSLVDNRAHQPISKIRVDNPQWAAQAIALLQAHGLFVLYSSKT